MKKFIFSLLALAIALTACKKHQFSDEPETTHLPEPELGEMIVAGRRVPITNPLCVNTVNISDSYDGFFHFTFQDIENGKKMEMCLSKLHNGERVDLSKEDPVAGTEEMCYQISYDDVVLAYGSKTASAKYGREGSYMFVKVYDGWYYEIELSLVTEGGIFYACKYKGAPVPRMYNPNNPLVYYDGVFYTPSVYTLETSSGTINLTISIDGGMKFTVVIDEADNDNNIDLSVFSPSSTSKYSVSVYDGINPSRTIVRYDSNPPTLRGHAGSTLWVKIVGSKVSANVSLLTDDHILAFDFYSKEVSQ